MRGKEGAQSQGGRKLRITPAYAGKSDKDTNQDTEN